MPAPLMLSSGSFALVNDELSAQSWAGDLDQPEGFVAHGADIRLWLEGVLEDAKADRAKREAEGKKPENAKRLSRTELMDDLKQQLELYRRISQAESTVNFFQRRYAVVNAKESGAAEEATPHNHMDPEQSQNGNPLFMAVQQATDWNHYATEAHTASKQLRLALTETLYQLRGANQDVFGRMWEWLSQPFSNRPTRSWLDGWLKRQDIPWDHKALLLDAREWERQPEQRDEALNGVAQFKQITDLSRKLKPRLATRGKSTPEQIEAMIREVPPQLRELFQAQSVAAEEDPLILTPRKNLLQKMRDWMRELRGGQIRNPADSLSVTDRLWLRYGQKEQLGEPEGHSWWEQIEQLRAGVGDLAELKKQVDALKKSLPDPKPLTETEVRQLYSLAVEWLGTDKLPKSIDGFGQGDYRNISAELRDIAGIRTRGGVTPGNDGDIQIHSVLTGDMRKFMAFIHELGHAEIFATQAHERSPKGEGVNFIDRHGTPSSVQEAKAFLNEQLFFTLMRHIRPEDAVLQAHVEVARLGRLMEAGRSLERVLAEKAMRAEIETLGNQRIDPLQLNARLHHAVQKAAPNLAKYSATDQFTEAAKKALAEHPQVMGLPDIADDKPFKAASYLVAALTTLPLALAPSKAMDNPGNWQKANRRLMDMVSEHAANPQKSGLTLAAFSEAIDQSFGLDRRHAYGQIAHLAQERVRQTSLAVETTLAQSTASERAPAKGEAIQPVAPDKALMNSLHPGETTSLHLG